jgi:hypothetical protein
MMQLRTFDKRGHVAAAARCRGGRGWGRGAADFRFKSVEADGRVGWSTKSTQKRKRGDAREAISKHRFPTEANASRILSNLALSDISGEATSLRELTVD